ncbi:MAG: GNAT family N-acetyltransferase [Anaerolineales bacterium]|jgi:RimJ/RimL family protein N-acetyltransferase
MRFTVHPICEQDVEEIASWKYDPPYSIYNLEKKDIPILLDAKNRYFSIYDESQRIIGFCCFGEQAKVAGGVYSENEPDILDVGLGLHPSMVGRGRGIAFVDAILRSASDDFSPIKFRVTIADFNVRSQKTFLGLGFTQVGEFIRPSDSMKFVQLERNAIWIE